MNHNFFLFKEPKSQRAASNALLAYFSLSQLHSSAGNLPTVIASSYIDSFLALLRAWCSMSPEKRQQVKPLSTGGRHNLDAPREALNLMIHMVASGARLRTAMQERKGPTWERGALVRRR
jgi:hypothetical protein